MTFVIILLIVALIYIGGLWLLYQKQEAMIFFPEKLPSDFAFHFSMPFTEVNLAADGATIHALHFAVEQPRGVILYLHGNAGSLRDWGQVAANFLPYDYDVLVIDYRGYGKSTGSLTKEADILNDAEVAYTYLLTRYTEAEIIVYGRSIGSGPATYLAQAHQPQLLILETPFMSILEMALAHYPFVPKFVLKYPLRNDEWIKHVSVPVYFIHGTADALIPHTDSLKLAELHPGEHEVTIIEGGEHNNLSAFAQYHERIAEILSSEK